MIFVDRSRVVPPDALLAPGRDGLTEREKATTFYGDPANAEKTFSFKKYKEKQVVEALNQLFAGKCAYCESIATATQPVDVEHFRPKGGYNVIDVQRTVLKQPGYYWLAAEWDNLLPSCIDCNREREQAQPNGAPAKKTGKGNHFPLEDETKRATKPGEEARETVLLLNPCSDRPEEHLEFLDAGNIRSHLTAAGQESRKGQKSIEVYGLRRMGLVQARHARWIEIRAQITLVEDMALAVRDHPGDQRLKRILRDQLLRLRTYEDAGQPYAGMARQMIAAFLEARRTS